MIRRILGRTGSLAAAVLLAAPLYGQQGTFSALTNQPALPLAPALPITPQSPTIATPSGPASLQPQRLIPASPNAKPSGTTNQPWSLPTGASDTRQSMKEILSHSSTANLLTPAAAAILTQQTAVAVLETNLAPGGPSVKLATLFNTPEADRVLSKLGMFPPNNLWARNVLGWNVAPNSKKIIASIGRALECNYDMGFILVPPDQPRVHVKITAYPDESDKGPYPVPDAVPIEGWPIHPKGLTLEEYQRDKNQRGGDRHAIVLDPAHLLLYEFFMMRKTDAGWEAAQASIFNLRSNRLRPAGWTSADAAGLPILPGTVRYDELAAGHIDHALRVTVPRTRAAYVAPATHFASRLQAADLPRMGERLRLRKDFDIRSFLPAARTILIALKQHGLFVADNGNLFAISIAPDTRIPDLADELAKVPATAFEVVVTPD